MDKQNQIVPPHLNAEAYRTNVIDTRIVSYLDYIKIQNDGTVLIGSSDLTGRYWDGGASIFKDIAESKSGQNQEKRHINLTCGTADGCFIDSARKVLLCEDSGAVSIWSFNSDLAWPIWCEEKTMPEHDGAALAVDCLKPGSEYVTVGADGNAKVWDVNEMVCTRHYEAHTMPTYGVAVRPNSTTTFATSSYDDYVYLWDENIAKPAFEIDKNDCGVHCVQWLDENRLVYGDEAGVLRLMDIRNLELSYKLTEYPAPIHQLRVNSESNKIAVCCDNSIVSVCEITGSIKCNVVYHDLHMHSNFVRGVAWDHEKTNVLHTVGWNCDIKSHTILQ